EEAEEAVGVERAALVMDLAMIEYTDAKIEPPRVQLLEDAQAIDGAQPQGDIRRRPAQARHQPGDKRDLDRIGKPDAEHAVSSRWVESLPLQHGCLNLREGDPHGIGQGECARSRPHAVSASGKKLVTEQSP